MLVSQQMARETNITNRTTGLTLKQHRGTLHKKARKWTEKSLSLYQAEWRVWGEDEHKCSIISTAFRQIVQKHFLPWKHANFSADLVFLWVTFNRCLMAWMKLVFITAACERRKALPQLTSCKKKLSGNTTECLWCSYTAPKIRQPYLFHKIVTGTEEWCSDRVWQTAVWSESEWQERQFSQVSCEVKAWRGPSYSLLWLRSSITSAQIFWQQREVTSVRHLVDSAGAVSTCYAVPETLEATAEQHTFTHCSTTYHFMAVNAYRFACTSNVLAACYCQIHIIP